ncbi:MAG: 50S ribosomal protein L4 [Hydrogenophilales bacterium CG03_land_8_20_14_0_80_62_28]|nr:50S ribosomal protein L4 [Betaproteobacteria bacterium]OIO79418.1 MAG: 50S ribosomal protein L4 [Hydrogenophilaceae bacterium CG1_02_62_390]PIV22137.1 MAG: 50S ribosomal protein L4 [Hydrogenophilales bacterium CG03_land_8_20_14_0_80_62_28]PIW37782.1 MAG: 50S ribosomal protein L4 [Hydrogenophilales bacterium CG15_BIG_FIL_POST_REV_8_21_14_020_62_31]PIW71090.1 MAG: 50S ribosomal protein L4 [Hydrogenophilales bacterium CG12_big_fil_rev_8_21_14_0_65_61_21]PIX00607.1 MAG: 50S ribosomal protein L4
MDLKLIDDKGQDAGAVSASDTLFARDYNEPLVHQLVTAYMANGRSGDRAQLTRAEVRHSTKKPFKQKGTGNARAGMTSSPLWRGGGRAFPNKPDENFSQKVNRKMFRAGMAAILSQLARDGRLRVIDGITLEAPKTKLLAGKIKGMGIDNRVLIITQEVDDNLWLSSRNLTNVMVLEPRHADPVSLIRFDQVLITRDAVKSFEEMYA